LQASLTFAHGDVCAIRHARIIPTS